MEEIIKYLEEKKYKFELKDRVSALYDLKRKFDVSEVTVIRAYEKWRNNYIGISYRIREAINTVELQTERTYEKWTKEEDNKILEMKRNNYRSKEIAKELNRTTAAVDSRVKKLKRRKLDG